ncbi:MAG: hypothetical protein HZA50_07430 [Planctomycetes bacterium]|nr:hypothetical protein [Planctomycetota bacterium]
MSKFTAAMIILVVVLAAGGGFYALYRQDSTGKTGSGLGPQYKTDFDQYRKFDPQLLLFSRANMFPAGLGNVAGIAVGEEDRIYVAGDRAIRIFTPDGRLFDQFATQDVPQCIAVGSDAKLYVGMKDHVEVRDPWQGKWLAWGRLDDKARITAVAVGRKDVFAADTGNRLVCRYDIHGKLLGRFGKEDKAANVPGLTVYSTRLDVAIAPDGLLRVNNPGLLRVEARGFDGSLEGYWGLSSQDAIKKFGREIDGFCGCCNPGDIAVMPDGWQVTAEKGLPRVKLYDETGMFAGVVAGPDEFDVQTPWLDVAADSKGRVLVLDPVRKAVLVYVRRPPQTQTAPAHGGTTTRTNGK